MRVGVPAERFAGERRVAIVPDGVARLIRAGHEVSVESGAGLAAGHGDEAYRAAGATIVESGAPLGAAVVVKVQRPTAEEARRLATGTILIALLAPAANAELVATLAEQGVVALAMELVPRTTKAQSMDVLSSQATVAGYKAVLVGAAALPRFLPMLTTAAGTIAPARVFVIGAGVAGLQAIATARRLGAVVSAFDVRPAVKEQVQSLGATFVDTPAAAEGAGGYARELAAADQERVLEAIARHVPAMDLIIATAQIPGRPAPTLLTDAMLATMRPGSVVVDLAAESGGNCVATRPGETSVVHGVSVIGVTNLASTLPFHASAMYSRNVVTLLEHLTRPDGQIVVAADDPIAGPMCVTAGTARSA